LTSPRVSVVMPAHQAASTVGAAISSVLWQSYRDLELVVVDDGSSDRTAEIASSFDGQVVLLRQAHSGVAAARNRAMACARGELIAFCDADDIFLDGYLDALMSVYDQHPGIVTANAWWLFRGGVNPAKTRHKGRFPRADQQRRAILEQNFVSTMSLFPRRLIDDIGVMAEDLPRAEDWDFWVRAIYAGYRVAHQPKPLALYRWGATGLSSLVSEMDAAVLEVLRRVERRPDLTDEERSYVRLRLRSPDPHALARDADAALRGRQYAESARLYRQSADLCPSERRTVWKSRVISVSPRLAGWLIRARQLRIERSVGFDEHLAR
jgi:glycosyltransferase involved in cell wall biosynthesis